MFVKCVWKHTLRPGLVVLAAISSLVAPGAVILTPSGAVREGGGGLSLWWPYGLRFPDLVYILSFLFSMNIIEMIGISLRIVLRCFHDLMFLLCWEIKNSWFLIPDSWFHCRFLHFDYLPPQYVQYFLIWTLSWSCDDVLTFIYV